MTAVRLIPQRAEGLSDELAPLAALCEALVPALAASPEVQAYAIPGKTLEVDVVLGGTRECAAWDVRPDALGFHAITSRRRRDRKTKELYYEVADRHMAVINLDSGRFLLGRMDDPDLDCDVAAWLVTGPHEVFHALEWAKETGGLTPDELYGATEEAWEGAVMRTLRAIDTRLAAERRRTSRLGATEDVIEDRARAWVDRHAGLVAARCREAFPAWVACQPAPPRR